jgi:hypothetical protein
MLCKSPWKCNHSFWTFFRRTNPVEQLYAAWPAIMYLNATYGSYILEPMLKYQSTANGLASSYPAPDLGGSLPDIFEDVYI